jgi:hypothetical protein
VQKGDATEPRASRSRLVSIAGQACQSTEQSLDLGEEDPGERRDGLWSVSEESPRSPA